MKKILLSNANQKTLVDDEDYPLLNRLRWYVSDTGYAITDSPVKHLKMHKLIVGPIKKKVVIDHIDRNKLNNQKDNLRIVSQSVNSLNSDRADNAKNYHYSEKRGWIVDSKRLGVRYLPVPNTIIAERVVKRLKLGFPKDVALNEAINPTICLTNWGRNNITFKEYIEAKKKGSTIKKLRLETISKRGKAKK